jgi:DNA mismatch repair ATPase MutL
MPRGGGSPAPAAPPALARLPAATASRLRTHFIIGSLAQAAEELVHNALDAGAMAVAVRLDAAAGAACCADDGAGVPTAQLALLARRHHTSKLASLEQLRAGVPTLGFRGEALASIAGAWARLGPHAGARQPAHARCRARRHGVA